MEKFLEKPRHIEFQVIADNYGNVRAPGRARLLDAAPPPEGHRGSAGAGPHAEAARARWASACVEACKAVGYRSAGTLEFLYQDNEFYFIEMNTRIQVEHPVTEMVTGIDLVKTQLLIAAGEPLPFKQERHRAPRPRHRVPHQCRGSAHVHAVARAGQAVARAGRPGRARRQPRLLRLQRAAELRLDGRAS